MPGWQLQQRFLKIKRRSLKEVEYEFYQTLVKENRKYSNKKSPHVKVEITTIVAISENVKQRIKRAPDGQRLKNFGGPGVTRLQ